MFRLSSGQMACSYKISLISKFFFFTMDKFVLEWLLEKISTEANYPQGRKDRGLEQTISRDGKIRKFTKLGKIYLLEIF